MRAIVTARLDKLQEAIRFSVENPMLSTREAARRLDMSEATLRSWKKQQFWQEESTRMIGERAELTLSLIKEEQERFKSELRDEMDDLKKLRNAAKTNAAMFFKLANDALRDLATGYNPVQACIKAEKAGINKHADSAIKSTQAVAALNDKIFQIDLLLERLENG